VGRSNLFTTGFKSLNIPTSSVSFCQELAASSFLKQEWAWFRLPSPYHAEAFTLA
jgi:hypothetical protein